MVTTRVAATTDLTVAELDRIRVMVSLAFDGRLDDQDWHHALGGRHVILAEGDDVIGHAAVVPRQLLHNDQPIHTGYVEAVAVRAGQRGLGYGAELMRQAEKILRASYQLGALSSSGGVEGFYRARGWQAWLGPTYVMAPTGLTRTPEDDDSTLVLPVSSTVSLRLTGDLICDWREGDVW